MRLFLICIVSILVLISNPPVKADEDIICIEHDDIGIIACHPKTGWEDYHNND